MPTDPLTILPRPRSVTTTPKCYRLPRTVRIAASEQASSALRPAVRILQDSGSVDHAIRVGDGDPADIRIDERPNATEAYELSVTERGIDIAGGIPGIRHAAQSLIALLAPEVLLAGSGAKPMLAHCEISDGPALAYRGVMIDVARHFMPLSWLRRLIRIAAFHKLNVVHLHLTDDQGWRMPIDTFPCLTEIGGQRRQTLVGAAPGTTYDGIAHGGAYTKAELRALVAYAANYGITLVPEIDLPGHMVAAIAAYPEWGNASEPLEVYPTWGISTDIINTRPATIEALKTILGEVMDVFDSPYIHLGGDEVPTTDWENSAEVAELMERESLPSVRHVQGWIMDQLVAHVRAAGRAVLAWDEAVDAGISREVTILGWRSPERVTAAIEAGYLTIACPQQHFYLDYQSSLDQAEPLGIGRGRGAFIDLEQLLAYELPSEAVGVQANLWTEYVTSPQRAEYQLLPRLAAVADIAWRGARARPADLAAALAVQEERYAALGWDYRPAAGPGQRWSTTLLAEPASGGGRDDA